MENTNRSIFAFQGIPGMLIATVLLLSILAGLTYLGIIAQQNVMQNPYEFERSDLADVKMLESTDTEFKIMQAKE